MACKTCGDRWALVLAQQSNLNTMKDNVKSSDKDTTQADIQPASATPQPVPVFKRLDVNKVIEERRKALQDGKVINK